MADYKIGLSVQVVPDGIWLDDAGRQRCRISLVLRPAAHDANANQNTEVSLATLPRQILDLITSENFALLVEASEVPANDVWLDILTQDGTKRVALDQLRVPGRDRDALQAWLTNAVSDWSRIFNGDVENGRTFDQLRASLIRVAETSAGDKASSNPKVSFAGELEGDISIESENWNLLAVVPNVLESVVDMLTLYSWVISADRNKEAERQRMLGWIDLLPDVLSVFISVMAPPVPDAELANWSGRKPKDAPNAMTLNGRSLSADLIEKMTDLHAKMGGYYTEIGRNYALKRAGRSASAEKSNIEKTIDAEMLHGLSTGNVEDMLLKIIGQLWSVTRGADAMTPEGTVSALHASQLTGSSGAVGALSDSGAFIRQYRNSLMQQLLTMREDNPPAPAKDPTAVADKDEGKNDQKKSDGEVDDPSLRILSAITAFPRVAKYFGFTVDLHIPVTRVRNATNATNATDGEIYYGVVQARHPALPAGFSLPSAYRLTVETAGKELFGPAEEAEYSNHKAAEAKPFSDVQPRFNGGFVRMGSVNGAAGRFELVSRHGMSVMLNAMQFAQTVSTARAMGERREEINTTPGITLTHGITLVDHHAAAMRAEEGIRSKAMKSAGPSSDKPKILFADDLTMGYRLDIGIEGTGKEGQGVTWFSTSEREVVLVESIEQYARPEKEGRIKESEPWDIDRDAGMIRTVMRVVDELKPKEKTLVQTGKKGVVVSSDVQSYRGWSFALPSENYELKPAPAELPIPMLLTHPRAKAKSVDGAEIDNRLAPLRFGNLYTFACRAVFLNGGGVSWRQAWSQKMYRAAKDDPSRVQTWYLRQEPVRPPDVHLFEDLGTGEEANGASRRSHGEQSHLLLVRSHSSGAPVTEQDRQTRRIVVPPRSDLETLEHHGVFDRYEGTGLPPGAFPRLRLGRKSGRFPSVDDRDLTKDWNPDELDANGNPVPGSGHAQGDTIVIPGERKQEPERPFYPDPLAQLLCVAAVPQGESLTAAAAALALPLYPTAGKTNPWDVQIGMLELVAARRPGAVRLASDEWQDRPSEWNRVPLVRALVTLAPAEEADIWLWCAPGLGTSQNPHASLGSQARAFDMVRLFQKLGAQLTDRSRKALGLNLPGLFDAANAPVLLTPAKTHELWRDLAKNFSNGIYIPPLPGLFRHRKVTVVHAVQKPLVAPRLRNKLQALRIRLDESGANGSGADSDADRLRRAWEAYLAANGDRGHRQDQEGGTTAFLDGEIEYHRKSTAQIAITATWQEYGPGAVVAVEKPGPDKSVQFELKPPSREAELGAIRDITWTSGASSDSSVDRDLVRLQQTEEGGLRALSYNFGDHRARHLTITPVATSRYRSAFPDLPAADHQGQPNFSVKGVPQNVILRATARPDLPQVDSLELMKSTTEKRGGDWIEATSRFSVGLTMPRTWFSSGIGEELAVLFAAQRDKAGFDPMLDRYVTRWGADPTVVSGFIEEYMPMDRILGAQKLPGDFPLPPVSNELQALKLQAPLVTGVYRSPELDRNTGLWRCIFDIDPGASYMPFIRLALARYQKDAIKGLELSPPLLVNFQIPPARHVSVKVDKSSGIAATIRGAGYIKKNTDTGPGADKGIPVDRPYMEMQVMEEHMEAGRALGATPLTDTIGVDGIPSETMMWRFPALPVPASSGGRRFLLFKERDARGADIDNPGRKGSTKTAPITQILKVYLD